MSVSLSANVTVLAPNSDWASGDGSMDATQVPLDTSTLTARRRCCCSRSSTPMAAVAIIVDSQDRVLLTRRPAHMRTFPGVGALRRQDPDDASLMAAAARSRRGVGILPANLMGAARLPRGRVFRRRQRHGRRLRSGPPSRLLCGAAPHSGSRAGGAAGRGVRQRVLVPLRDLVGPLGRSEAAHVARPQGRRAFPWRAAPPPRSPASTRTRWARVAAAMLRLPRAREQRGRPR